MAASIDYTERCHIDLVRGLRSTRSFAVSTIVSSHHMILGHLAPRNRTSADTTLGISLLYCSFFVFDVTCSPREESIVIHADERPIVVHAD